MEGDRRPRTTPCQAQRGHPTLLGAVWCILSHHLHLLYCRLVLPLCQALSAATAGTQRRAGHCQRDQSETAGRRPEPPPGMAWGAAEPPDCAICLQPCELLSCSHVYHGTCIDRWHRAQPGTKSCPLCLHRVTAVLLGHPGTHSPHE